MEVIIWGLLILFPNRDSLAYFLLELIAICGEWPAGLVPIPYSRNYVNNVLSYLKRIGLVNVYLRDHLRGYRLTAKAKAYLLAENYDRFHLCLTGSVETNQTKGELPRRIRLHRLAEIYLFMLQCEVSVFYDTKPLVFTPEKQPLPEITTSAFYTSREIRQLGMDAIRIRGARMAGVLMTPTGVFLTYNCITGFNKLDFRFEDRARASIKAAICYERFAHQYEPEQVCGLMVGADVSAFTQVIASGNSNLRNYFLLDGNFTHIYYLTNDRRGIVMFKLLCDTEKTDAFNQIIMQDLYPPDPYYLFPNDGFDSYGNPVLLGYFLDIPRINRFCMGLRLHQQHGIIFCFDFQQNMLSALFGSLITIQAIDFECFERSFFPSDDTST